ncbi:MAG: permease-like cell division protein FtsX [bacterium]|nr:permease-like cell division protein FtsX [bacterium]
MATSLARIIKYGLQNFWRNKWLSTATLAVMTLALFVFENLIFFSVLSGSALDVLKDKIDISVYFKIDTKEDDVLKVKRSLESLTEVKTVEYISRDQALELFQERHKNDQTISQAISILDENPLSASLNIKANDPRQYPAIASYLNNQNLSNYIEQVTYNQNQLVINRLASIVDTGQKGGIVLTLTLAIVSVLVTLNTIMLAIYSSRDEIGIMRLVGAPNKFIRGPYIFQGVLYGILAAVISLILAAPAVSLAAPYINALIPEMNFSGYFYSNLFSLFLYQTAFGVVLGTVSSGLAVRKYLKI